MRHLVFNEFDESKVPDCEWSVAWSSLWSLAAGSHSEAFAAVPGQCHVSVSAGPGGWNIKTFNILMNAAANRNDLNATEHWFQVALAKGILVDSAMVILGDNGPSWAVRGPETVDSPVVQREEAAASRWYSALQQRRAGRTLTAESVAAVAIAAARKGRTRPRAAAPETQSWQHLAQQHGLAEDVRLYEAVLQSCAAAPASTAAGPRPAELARRCFETAKQRRVKRLGPQEWWEAREAMAGSASLTLQTFNALIDAVGRHEGLRSAERTFAKVIEEGLRPDRVTFTVMPGCRGGDPRRAMKRCNGELAGDF
eukprot:Skav227437  [mRNA]  locus=scaffold203:322672:333507:+ [translate_table: standard]